MPKISVIVPVYNVEKYLHECVDSILAQTFTDFELILINDGSQDNSGAICDGYASKDSRITVIHQENQGQAVARNNAIAIAKGDWIHFVDSDDLIHAQMLEILYSAVDENTQMSSCNLYKDDNLSGDFWAPKSECNFKKHPINDDELISLFNDKHHYWIACAKLIKKEIIEKYPFTPGRIYEDNGVVFKWFNATKFVNITDEQLYFYRTTPKSTTNIDFSLKKLDVLWAFQEQIKYYESTDFNRIKKLVNITYANICAGMYLKLLEDSQYTNEAKKLKKELKTFVRGKKKIIEYNNFLYGVLYPKPIRIIFRLERLIKNFFEKRKH